MDNSADEQSPSKHTVLVLGLCLLVLILLLIFLYKKLVKQSNGEYAIRHMVYKDGGIRDRTRAAALTIGSHLGMRLWPASNSYQDREEMQEVTYDVGQVEDGCGHESDSEEEEEAGEKDDYNPHVTSSSGGSEAESQSRHEAEVTEEVERRKEEEEEEEEEEEVEDKGETSGGLRPLIDLKQFSGSVIWSEEEGGEEERNVTAL